MNDTVNHDEPETDSYNRGLDNLRYKKSIRRHHRARIIEKRIKRVKQGRWFVKDPGYLGKNNTVCSCAMCGNPRKFFGEATRQEKIAEMRLQQDLPDTNVWVRLCEMEYESLE